MLGAGQNIDLRQSINDKLSKSADPLGLYSRYGMEAPYSYGDVAQQAIGATDLYAPIAAGEAIEAAKKGEWKKSGLSALGALPIIGALKASHGSPHAFTKFDFSKIGTGEGAQAYGHGGYFAQGFDSPVAQRYAQALVDREKMNEINQKLSANGREIAKAFGKPNVDELNKEAELLYQQREDLLDDPGHLYNVELKWPDPAREAADPLGEHHLLDWDAPLSGQHNSVLSALENEIGYPEGYLSTRNDRVGRKMWETFVNRRGSPEDAALRLKEIGIPGIRYLDQGSRAAGTGSRNYVMFDDALANIVSRNGVSLSDLLRR